jgi:hypothetical protein
MEGDLLLAWLGDMGGDSIDDVLLQELQLQPSRAMQHPELPAQPPPQQQQGISAPERGLLAQQAPHELQLWGGIQPNAPAGQLDMLPDQLTGMMLTAQQQLAHLPQQLQPQHLGMAAAWHTATLGQQLLLYQPALLQTHQPQQPLPLPLSTEMGRQPSGALDQQHSQPQMGPPLLPQQQSSAVLAAAPQQQQLAPPAAQSGAADEPGFAQQQPLQLAPSGDAANIAFQAALSLQLHALPVPEQQLQEALAQNQAMQQELVRQELLLRRQAQLYESEQQLRRLCLKLRG